MKLATTRETVLDHAERDGAVYDLSRPEEQIAAGALLELVDFQNAAVASGAMIGLGTQAFKTTIHTLTGPHSPNKFDCPSLDPFCQVWRLPGKGEYTVYHQDVNLTYELADYYVEAQALYDFYDQLRQAKKVHEVYGPRVAQVVRSVLYDEVEIEAVTRGLPQ